MNRFTPTIHHLQVMGGIALLGVLLMNIQTYGLVSPWHSSHWLNLDQSGSYVPVAFFLSLFIKGQFELMVGVVAGLWFNLQWQTDTENGLNAHRSAKHRLTFLLGLGLVHSLLFWFGNELLTYALLGYTLLYFQKQSLTSLRNWIVGLTFLALFIPLGLSLIPLKTAPQEILHLKPVKSVWVLMRTQFTAIRLHCQLELGHYSVAFLLKEIMLLAGLMASKLDIAYRLSQIKVRFSLLMVLLFPIAFIIKSFSVLLELELVSLPIDILPYRRPLIILSGFLGTLLVTLVYLLEIGLNGYLKPVGWSRLLGGVGQAGLSNYLLQPLLCTLFFYGHGLGPTDRLTLPELLGVGVVIYALEVLLSFLWLAKYGQGPIEWLYNRITYGKPSLVDATPTKDSQ